MLPGELDESLPNPDPEELPTPLVDDDPNPLDDDEPNPLEEPDEAPNPLLLELPNPLLLEDPNELLLPKEDPLAPLAPPVAAPPDNGAPPDEGVSGAPSPPEAIPASGFPKNPFTVVFASPTLISRQSVFPVIGSTYRCRRNRILFTFSNCSIDPGYCPPIFL